jgi:hypothetical protein
MTAGILNQIMFGQESAWGSAATPAKGLAIHAGEGIQTDLDKQYPANIRGVLAKNSTVPYIGKSKHEGNYEFDVIPGNFGYLLKSLFGGLNSATKAGETLVYEHTYSEAETKPSYTFEQAVGDIIRRYAGGIVTAMKLSAKAGESLQAAVTIQAKTNASNTKTTFSAETIRPFNFADCLQASGFKVGSVFLSQVENFELEIKNGGEMVHSLGSVDPSFFYTKGHEVTGKFEIYLDTTTDDIYTDYLANTQRSLDIAFAGDAIGSSSKYGLSIAIPKADFKVVSFPVSENYNLLKVEFEGIYDTVTSKLISAVLTNLQANYTT